MTEEKPVPLATAGALINTPWGPRMVLSVCWLDLFGPFEWLYMVGGMFYHGRQIAAWELERLESRERERR